MEIYIDFIPFKVPIHVPLNKEDGELGVQLKLHVSSPQEGYGVMVLNTNRNHDFVRDKKVPIRVSAETRFVIAEQPGPKMTYR